MQSTLTEYKSTHASASVYDVLCANVPINHSMPTVSELLSHSFAVTDSVVEAL